MEDLLTLAGTSYQNIKYIGCVLQVNVIWTCGFDRNSMSTLVHLMSYVWIGCQTQYEIYQIDQGTGYSQKHVI